MAKSLTGTVLRRFDIVVRNTQIVTFEMGQAIEVVASMRDAIEGGDNAYVAWDGEIPPHSKSLPKLHSC